MHVTRAEFLDPFGNLLNYYAQMNGVGCLMLIVHVYAYCCMRMHFCSQYKTFKGGGWHYDTKGDRKMIKITSKQIWKSDAMLLNVDDAIPMHTVSQI